jgi:pimeloyl-ACP methyl ester carboxylesterase
VGEVATWVVGMDRDPEAVDAGVRRRVTEMLLVAYANGEADPDILAAGIPGAERVVPDRTAHLPGMERPDEFNRVVLGFLAELDRPA